MRSPGLPLLVLLLAEAGCGLQIARRDPPPIDPFSGPPPGLAQVCVLRPRLAPSALIFSVRDNGKLVGATRGSSYFCYHAEPGPHRVTSQRGGIVEEAVRSLEVDKRYFLYQNVDPYPDATRSWLSWTTEADARSMVGECVYRVLSSVPGKDELPGERPRAKADPELAVAAAKGGDSDAAAKDVQKEPEAPQVAPKPTSDSSEPVIDAKTAPDPIPLKKRKRR